MPELSQPLAQYFMTGPVCNLSFFRTIRYNSARRTSLVHSTSRLMTNARTICTSSFFQFHTAETVFCRVFHFQALDTHDIMHACSLLCEDQLICIFLSIFLCRNLSLNPVRFLFSVTHWICILASTCILNLLHALHVYFKFDEEGNKTRAKFYKVVGCGI